MTSYRQAAWERERGSTWERERGSTLLGAVLVSAILVAATAATLWLADSELWAAGRARSAVQARYTAEAGLRHALDLVAPGLGFDALLAGRGGLVDRSRPGPLPLPGGGWVDFPGPPFGYEVLPEPLPRAGERGAEKVVLRAKATAVRDASRVVVGIVGRRAEPYAPAALVLETGDLGAPLVIDATMPGDGEQAVIAAPSEEAAAQVLDGIVDAGGEALGVRSTAPWRRVDLEDFAISTGLDIVAASEIAGAEGGGDRAVAVRSSGGQVDGLVGRGAVLVAGDLVVSGDVDYRGALLVAGELELDAATCSISGMVWARRLRVSRPCAIRYDASDIARADQVLRLPREPVLLSMRDEG